MVHKFPAGAAILKYADGATIHKYPSGAAEDYPAMGSSLNFG